MSVKKVIENLNVAKTINIHCKQTKSLKYSLKHLNIFN